MKKRLIFLSVLLLVMLGLVAVASAADDPVKVSMELSSNSFSTPKEITVSITVTNTGESDMPGPVTLYYPSGKQVEEFGSPTLSVGASQNWSGTWKVTQAQLEAGKVTFKIKYSIYNDNQELVNKTKNFSKAITYTGAVDQVEINRTVTPTTAQKGQTVTVTYDIVNAGTIDISDVTIKENSSISSKKGTISKVAAGEKESYTFTTTMGTKDLTSQATITYKSSGKTQTVKKEATTIRYGEISLNASLSADKKGGAIGDTATLTLTLSNTGKLDVQNISVKDGTLGEVFSGQSVAAGEKLTLTKEVEINQTTDYQFTVTGEDADGLTVEAATSRVTLTAVDPTQIIGLTVTASADRDTVYTIPGTVKFTISVTNESQVDVTNVNVYAVNTKLYSFPTILAGETRSFVRDVHVSMAGQYQFTARCTDQLGETLSFDSNIIPIAYAQPTAVPTEAPIVTPPAPVYEPDPTDDGVPESLVSLQSALDSLKYVFAVIAGLGFVLLLIGCIRRGLAKAHSKSAMDHFEVSGRRDYMKSSGKEEKEAPQQEAPQEEAEVSYDDTGDEQDSMQEALNKLYGDESAEDAEAAPEEATAGQPEEKSIEEAPVEAEEIPPVTEELTFDEEEEEPRRHRR